MVVHSNLLVDRVVMEDANWGVVGPSRIRGTRDIGVEFVYDGVAAGVDVAMKLGRSHGKGVEIAMVLQRVVG